MPDEDSAQADIAKVIAEGVQLETFDFPEGRKHFMTIGEFREWARNRIISRNGISAAFSIAALAERSDDKQRRARFADALAQEARGLQRRHVRPFKLPPPRASWEIGPFRAHR